MCKYRSRYRCRYRYKCRESVMYPMINCVLTSKPQSKKDKGVRAQKHGAFAGIQADHIHGRMTDVDL